MVSTAVPIDVYLRSSFEPDAEYVDGEIQERPWANTITPPGKRRCWCIFASTTKEWHIRVKPELRVQVAETRFRVPDITVLDRDQPIEQIVTHPPIAVFEVLSPEDIMARMLVKLADYERMGIAGIFLIDPKGSKYRFANGSLTAIPAGPTPCGRLVVNLQEIEQLLD